MILVRIIFTLLISTFICTTSICQHDKKKPDDDPSNKVQNKEYPYDATIDAIKPAAPQKFGAQKTIETKTSFKEIYLKEYEDCKEIEDRAERLMCFLESCRKCWDIVLVEKPDPFGPRGPVFNAGKPDPFGPVSGSYKPNPFNPRDPIGPIGKITVEIYR